MDSGTISRRQARGLIGRAVRLALGRARRLARLLWYRVLRLRYFHYSHTRFYQEIMKRRTSRDPRNAVGGMWDEMGELEFQFLQSRGLEPRHSLLDVGCGCLRGGIHFVRYLEKGHYCGIDISPEILEAGGQFLVQADLQGKQPRLIQVHDLKFSELEGRRFDFLLAWSVFTHMPIENIEECFAHLDRVMKPESRFFATYFDGGEESFTPDHHNFFHGLKALMDLGHKHGLQVRKVTKFNHPRQQQMLEIKLSSPG